MPDADAQSALNQAAVLADQARLVASHHHIASLPNTFMPFAFMPIAFMAVAYMPIAFMPIAIIAGALWKPAYQSRRDTSLAGLH